MTEVSEHGALSGAWRSLAQDAVAARVKGEILRVVTEGRLKPGDRLPSERELAAMLAVSRPSVREAVQILRAEGWLTVRHGAGIFVAEPENRGRLRRSLSASRDLDQLFDMREVIEVPASRWAAERQLPAITEVRAAYDKLEEHITSGAVDWEELQRLDITFHTRIVQAAENSLLEQTQSIIYDMILEGMRTTLSAPGRMEASRVEHLRLVEAIEAGNGDAAATTARAHVRGARAAAEQNRDALARETSQGATAADRRD